MFSRGSPRFSRFEVAYETTSLTISCAVTLSRAVTGTAFGSGCSKAEQLFALREHAMRSLMVFGVLALGLTACVDVHNPPPRAQQPSTVVVPSSPPPTTTVICPAGSIC
jgi:hypothetical protein